MNKQSNFSKIRQIERRVSRGATFLAFSYTKENGEQTRRNVLVNVDIAARQERVGAPLKGKKTWQTGNRFGRNGCFVRKGKEVYLSCYDQGGKDKFPKNFKISNITEIC